MNIKLVIQAILNAFRNNNSITIRVYTVTARKTGYPQTGKIREVG